MVHDELAIAEEGDGAGVAERHQGRERVEGGVVLGHVVRRARPLDVEPAVCEAPREAGMGMRLNDPAAAGVPAGVDRVAEAVEVRAHVLGRGIVPGGS